MTTQLQKAKNDLIQMFVAEIKEVMATKVKVNAHYKIGWVDWVSDDLQQHEFVGIYTAMNGSLMLVEASESQANKNLKIEDVTDILRLEWILKGLHENNKNIADA